MAAALLTLASLAVVAPSARGETPRVPIPDISAGALAVSADYVFVIERGDDQVVVFDDALNLLGTLTDVPFVQGLLVQDTTLYVSVTGADRIDAFDLTQPFPFVRTSFPTTPVDEPVALAWAGGQLWFRGTSDTASSASLHSMSASGAVSVHDGVFVAGSLETSPARPGEIIVVGYTQIVRYSVAGGSPAVQASVPLGTTVRWADWSPDGSELVLGHSPGNAPAGSWALDADSLAHLRRFGGVGHAGVVSADSNRLLLATRPASEGRTDLDIHRISDGARLSTHQLTSQETPRDDGLALHPDGTRIFMIGQGLYGSVLFAFPADPQSASVRI
ncbi:MAG: hypothetical protein ACRDGW_12140, partial [Actinomycetota bacterium]